MKPQEKKVFDGFLYVDQEGNGEISIKKGLYTSTGWRIKFDHTVDILLGKYCGKYVRITVEEIDEKDLTFDYK